MFDLVITVKHLVVICNVGHTTCNFQVSHCLKSIRLNMAHYVRAASACRLVKQRTRGFLWRIPLPYSIDGNLTKHPSWSRNCVGQACQAFFMERQAVRRFFLIMILFFSMPEILACQARGLRRQCPQLNYKNTI